MDRFGGKSWMPVALLVGILYFALGFVLGTFGGWRLAAWIVCGIIYGCHISYEYFKLHNTPLLSSLHVAAAVALGGFLVAVAAIVNSLTRVSGSGSLGLLLLALIAFPFITALPALALAFVGTSLLRRFSKSV